MKRIARLFHCLILLLLVSLLIGCTGSPADPTVNVDGQSAEIDLSEFENYQQLLDYMAENPEVNHVYQVSIGGQVYPHDVTEMTITHSENVYDSLMENLQFLPNVKEVVLHKTELSLDQILALRNAYPDVNIQYNFVIAGKPVSEKTKWLDLSHITSDNLEEVLNKLPMMPNLVRVALSSGAESNLELTDVNTLQDAAPGVFFDYQFDLFGQTISTADETVAFDEVPIGNEGEERIRQALDVLDRCTYFKLDDCGIDNEVMAKLREDYPDTKVVWRVHIEPFSMLTDETMLRLTFHLNDNNIHDLKYLNDVTYLDVGHNIELTDVSFVQYMPKLECVIISGSEGVDVSYFRHCPNLIWLEMCFCYNIEDISCLKDHPTLKYLNISFSKVSDLTPLDNVKLERMMSMGIQADWEQRMAFEEKHPDCISVWTGVQPYGYGWRYNDYGYTFFEYYANMREVFRYAEQDYFGNHKEK